VRSKLKEFEDFDLVPSLVNQAVQLEQSAQNALVDCNTLEYTLVQRDSLLDKVTGLSGVREVVVPVHCPDFTSIVEVARMLDRHTRAAKVAVNLAGVSEVLIPQVDFQAKLAKLTWAQSTLDKLATVQSKVSQFGGFKTDLLPEGPSKMLSKIEYVATLLQRRAALGDIPEPPTAMELSVPSLAPCLEVQSYLSKRSALTSTLSELEAKIEALTLEISKIAEAILRIPKCPTCGQVCGELHVG
jgi:hypothetical protein